MKHDGYTITPVEEDTFDHQMKKTTVTSYKVEVDGKVVAVGLPTEAAAKEAIRRRRCLRENISLDPVG